MAHRIRNQQQQHLNRTSDAAVSSNKRKRDVLQDISEEHSGNGAASRPSQHQHVATSASTSRRAQQAPRRPSPMAPARRASVRRSRRLSEQQPSSAGRTGGRTVSTAASGGDNAGAGANGGGGERGTGGGSDEEGYEGGMSCDEDLEGMVVDLSFEGVADDSVWREREKQSDSAGSHPANSGDGAGGKGAGTEGGGGSEAESSSSSGSSSGSGNSQLSNEKPDVDQRRVSRLRDRSGMTAGGGRGRHATGGSLTTAGRETGSGGRDGRVLRGGPAAGEKTGARRGRREILESETEATFSRAVSGGRSVDPQATHTPLAKSKASAVCEAKRNASAAAGARTPLPAGVDDIDVGVWDEGDSHLRNPDYVVEHAAFLKVQEKRNRPAAYIGARQKDMRQSMRSVLVDWIVEVCDQFKLSSRTLFQVVDLIDRSLTAFEVPRGKLQLLGCACVVLASKYEEIYAPTAEELAHISDNTYTRAEIISMELVVVNALQFRLSCITPCNFVERFCRAARSNARERSLVAYLLELLLQDYQGVTLLPSLKAAAALYLARQTLHPRGSAREAWTKQTEYYTGYGARALEGCVRRLHSLHNRAEANNLHAVRDKYKKSALHRVAEVTCALEDALHFGDA